MQSFYRPQTGYVAPDMAHLDEFRTRFARRGEFSGEYDSLRNLIVRLYDTNKRENIIGFWLYYLELHGERNDANATKESFAKEALNISVLNTCDAETRLKYLLKFHKVINSFPEFQSINDRVLYQVACLLYELNPVGSPDKTNRDFSCLTDQYFLEKNSKRPSLMDYAKNQIKKIAFNHSSDRSRQIDFLKIASRLCSMLSSQHAAYHFKEIQKAIALWIVLEIELESTQQTSQSDLYKILLKFLHGGSGQTYSHSNDIPDNIKQLRLEQLSQFLAKITPEQWFAAATAAHCVGKQFDIFRTHYINDAKKILAMLADTEIFPISTQQAAVQIIKDARWKLGKVALACAVPYAVSTAYSVVGMDYVVAQASARMASYAGEMVRPALRFLVEPSAARLGAFVLSGGALKGMELAATYGVDALENNSLFESKEDYEDLSNAQINFIDFMTLCAHDATNMGENEKADFYNEIIKIFPNLDRAHQRIFNRNVVAFYLSNTDKTTNPFFEKKPVEPEAIAVPQQVPFVPLPASAPPMPEVKSSFEPMAIAPGALQAGGLFSDASKQLSPQPPPYSPLAEPEYDDCVISGPKPGGVSS